MAIWKIISLQKFQIQHPVSLLPVQLVHKKASSRLSTWACSKLQAYRSRKILLLHQLREQPQSNESWRKIKNFLKTKGQRDYPALHHANKVAKTNADKAQLLADSVERHFGIESDHFDSNHFDKVNKFIEDNHRYFYPPENPDDYLFVFGNEHELVADVDTQTLIKLVKFLKRGEAPGPDTIHNEMLRLGTTISLFHPLTRLFTSSIQLGYIPTAWRIATLHMLLKPDKLPSLTTSYRPISLISSIMKLFERVIEQRLRSHPEHIGFINKHQSAFRKAKSTDDHLFRLSQSIMESFNRGEHVVAAFLNVGKAFDNVWWHNGLRFKIFQLDLPTRMTRSLSDFLVGRLIQVNVNNFLSNQINPKAGVPQGSVLSTLLFLIYTNDLPTPHHNKTLYPSSLMILLNGPLVETYVLQPNFCNRTF